MQTELFSLSFDIQRVSTEDVYQEITDLRTAKSATPITIAIDSDTAKQSASAVCDVAISDIRMQDHLSSGSFATVDRGTFQGTTCAVKRPGKHVCSLKVCLERSVKKRS